MPRERYYFLDGIRGIAAVLVAIHHFTQYSPSPVLTSAYFSVDVFFILSGFVITKAYMDQISLGMPFAQFISLRLGRLYPMFFLGLVLGLVALLAKYHLGQTRAEEWQIWLSFTLNLFYIPSIFPRVDFTVFGTDVTRVIFPADNPGWTLFYELLINCLFFILWRSRFYSKALLMKLLLMSGALFIIAILLGAGHSGWGSKFHHILLGSNRTFFGFGVGVVIASLPAMRRETRTQGYLACLVIGSLLGLATLPDSRYTFMLAVLVAPGLVYAGSAVALGGAARSLCKWLGNFSYPLYCIHYPILMLLDVTGVMEGPYRIPAMTAGVIGSIALATALENIVDLPIRQRLASRARSSSSANAQSESSLETSNGKRLDVV